MKLTFLGTRGETETRTRRHPLRSSLLVSSRGAAVMIDCDVASAFPSMKAPSG